LPGLLVEFDLFSETLLLLYEHTVLLVAFVEGFFNEPEFDVAPLQVGLVVELEFGDLAETLLEATVEVDH